MSQDNFPDLSLDLGSLVSEETFSDSRAGSIRRLTPIKPDGSVDDSRSVEYTGHTQVMTEAGPLPVNFTLEVESLEQAVEQFPAQAEKALEEMIRRIEEMRREQASSIVTPGQGGFGGGMGGGGPQPGGPSGGFKLP
ncbi:hypothetical protein J2T57_000179 [Natronocella acetinitrilica]|jgi:hypothetical protein|uniref:Cytoplasmic protein n=1 Tax=Natronocella acetinitrilica TaxID=414046 RepID=A0AAE3KEH5_9GAMM|nr:hypothetical protein [Natronocella acetinitrilica]MCP1673087.1 hypothetical protein [Natronocella acetinitrilica]